MTTEEPLALAGEIAARTKLRFVVNTSREEARQARLAEAKRLTEALASDKSAGAGLDHWSALHR
jgi:phosphoglycerate dehydrogenase-like enzyme